MSIFGADHDPTPAERLREGAYWVLLLAFAVGFVWLSSWLDDMGRPRVDTGLWVVLLLLAPLIFTSSRMTAWLERGRSTKPGEWRTTRATRISALCSGLLLGGYGYNMPFQMHMAWMLGDVPRLVGATVGTAVCSALVLVILVRRARAKLELSIDERGVFTPEWRGLVPWAAIDFVLAARKEDDSMRFVLKPEALAELPDFVRRRNGFLDLNLSATSLTASAALEALSAAYPVLEVRRSRSAGLVLPVRGATDIVEADL
ncbi:hypothetical protein J2800_002651 [Caulobacter rhizosphaerae]|jgi:hypothetical protein|uniref:Histidine kinase n=1 Tax=Caulobacter rhizosphaerae TaxID=2010972 RepID=A0ABU1N0N4_9CAUL|nr:hypothetical protein [Caulobacter rhizosphaerae]MDR6531898.1 hypothetical protein [Caulobacter rhizosphaerae]